MRQRSTDGRSDGSDKLPVQRQESLLKIHQDITSDREAVKSALARSSTERPQVVLARTFTRKSGDADDTPLRAYSAATKAARSHHMARRSTTRRMADIDQEHKENGRTVSKLDKDMIEKEAC